MRFEVTRFDFFFTKFDCGYYDTIIGFVNLCGC